MNSRLKVWGLLALLGALTVAGWMATQPEPAYAMQYCQWSGRACFNEGYSYICWYEGCCGYIGTGTCTCIDGYWSCPERPECPPDFCP